MLWRNSDDQSPESGSGLKLPAVPLFTRASSPAQQNPDSALASRHISLPASQRLTAITEDGGNELVSPAPTIPPRNPLRNSGSSNSTPPPRWPGRRVSRFSEDTTRTAPPAYEWVPDSETENVPNPADDEKLNRLRRGETHSGRRGGWWRLIIILLLALLVIVGLAVGLGVGLTRKKHSKSSGSAPGSSSPSVNKQASFPVGSFTIPTTLKSTSTACTSETDIWQCNPPIPFDWIITNTSALYASNTTTLTTSSSGVPANLSVSTSGDPFSIIFTNESMTYISSDSSTGSAQLTFNFIMKKSVYPSQPIAANGQTAECIFNATTFTGTLYLSSQPNLGTINTTVAGGGTTWPYAVNISQTSPGGPNVPNCFVKANGAPVTIAHEAADETCMCKYANH